MKSKNSSLGEIYSLNNIPSLTDLDRFIPSKKTFQDLELKIESRCKLNQEESNENSIPDEQYKINLRQELLKKAVFSQKNLCSFNPFQEKKLFSMDMLDNFEKFRHISDEPFKVLDAPMLQDDFYLNVLEWSNQNVLGVGLGNCVYTWNFTTNEVDKMMEFDNDDYVASVTWNSEGSELAIGSITGRILLWDVNKSKSFIF
jgi:WD40 repeat protein